MPNRGQVYQGAVTGLSVIPGWGLAVGGGALAIDGACYYFTGQTMSNYIDSNTNPIIKF